MIRKAEAADTMAMAAFLEAHIETSMFLLGNLELFGTDNTTHPYGTAFFLRETGDGITGIFGCTNAGFLMCQLPGLSRTEAQTYAHLLKGYTLRGMTGAAEQVATILGALPVAEDAWAMDADEPLFSHDLANLPGADADLRRPVEADCAVLEAWMRAYLTETGTGAGRDVDQEAQARADRAIAEDHTRILFEGDAPVAMTALNARAGGAVQIGGVYVPPDLRGAGRAGQAVAAHLRELAQAGVTRAILFAASDAAASAYTKIGFQRIGTYKVAMLKEPMTLADPA